MSKINTIVTTAIITLCTVGAMGAVLRDAAATQDKNVAFIERYGLTAYLTHGDGVSDNSRYTLVTRDGYCAGSTSNMDTLLHTMKRRGLVHKGDHYVTPGIMGHDAWEGYTEDYTGKGVRMVKN